MSIRLRQIALVANKLQPVLDDLRAVLGLEVCFVDEGVASFGLENSLLPIGKNFLEVVAPVRENTAGGRYLERRQGDGGYMVICQCDRHPTQLARRARAEELGVRLALEHETDDYHIMQLHPADTGGSFLEIDWDAREEPEGNWGPAGGSAWTHAMRTHVVSDFTAAELQSPDPTRLAERWSAITEIPLAKNSAGQPELPLENARLRFVPAEDGRGEGLGGVDLRVVDRARLLEAADQRGLRVSDDQVLICGVRFYLTD